MGHAFTRFLPEILWITQYSRLKTQYTQLINAWVRGWMPERTHNGTLCKKRSTGRTEVAKGETGLGFGWRCWGGGVVRVGRCFLCFFCVEFYGGTLWFLLSFPRRKEKSIYSWTKIVSLLRKVYFSLFLSPRWLTVILSDQIVILHLKKDRWKRSAAKLSSSARPERSVQWTPQHKIPIFLTSCQFLNSKNSFLKTLLKLSIIMQFFSYDRIVFQVTTVYTSCKSCSKNYL